MSPDFYTILSSYEDKIEKSKRGEFRFYIIQLIRCRFDVKPPFQFSANMVGNLIMKGVDYAWLRPDYLLHMNIIVGDNSNLISHKDVGEYYYRFIQESKKIYDYHAYPDTLYSYQLWMMYYAIPWFFAYITTYILNTTTTKRAAFEIWGESWGNKSTSYLQWPPEEVMNDILDLDFEDKIRELCPSPKLG